MMRRRIPTRPARLPIQSRGVRPITLICLPAPVSAPRRRIGLVLFPDL